MNRTQRTIRLVCSALMFGSSLALLCMGAPEHPIVGMAFGVYVFMDVLKP